MKLIAAEKARTSLHFSNIAKEYVELIEKLEVMGDLYFRILSFPFVVSIYLWLPREKEKMENDAVRLLNEYGFTVEVSSFRG